MTEITNEAVIDSIKAVCPEIDGPVSPGSSIEDLGIDSLATIEIIFDLEEKLGTSIDYDSHSATITAGTTVEELTGLLRDLAVRDQGAA